jgi:hypothetical protein
MALKHDYRILGTITPIHLLIAQARWPAMRHSLLQQCLSLLRRTYDISNAILMWINLDPGFYYCRTTAWRPVFDVSLDVHLHIFGAGCSHGAHTATGRHANEHPTEEAGQREAFCIICRSPHHTYVHAICNIRNGPHKRNAVTRWSERVCDVHTPKGVGVSLRSCMCVAFSIGKAFSHREKCDIVNDML